MNQEAIHLVFAGGGTAGHLFPGLAVAEQLIATIPRLHISFCGGGKALERQAVRAAGFDYLTLPVQPLPRRARDAIAFVVDNLAGYLAASRILQEQPVAAVVGLGGYASVPMAHAAIRRGVPLILLEQNAIPGKATRWLARRASLVCTSFHETWAHLRCTCPVRCTGNPVRRGFLTANRLQSRLAEVAATLDRAKKEAATLQKGIATYNSAENRLKQILVLGGSGGARSLNESVPRALYRIRTQLADWQILHQSGDAGLPLAESLYRKFGLPAKVVPFLENMPAALAATDLAICRAGGSTLAELAVARVPAVLIPFPNATDGHQLANARLYATQGGCVTIDERSASGSLDDQLADILCFLLANDSLLGRMAEAMHHMAAPRAAEHVAELIWSIASSRSRQPAHAMAC